MTGQIRISLQKVPARLLDRLFNSARTGHLEYRFFGFQSGLLSVGTLKSDAKTRFVFPPFVGVTVPDSGGWPAGRPGGY